MPDQDADRRGDCGHEKGCGCGCGCRNCVRDGPLTPDPIVDGIDPDCCGPAGLVMLKGYLAQGDADDLWRLYRSITLDEYVLIRDDDIVAQRRIGDESWIWLCGDHVVRWVRVRTAARLQEEFLQGEILQRLTSRQVLGLLGQGGTGGRGGGLEDIDSDGPLSTAPSRRAACC